MTEDVHLRRWRAWLGVVLVLAALLGVRGPTVAIAATSTTGGGTFEGTVTLTGFPCASCSGTFTGSVALHLSGVGTSTVSGLPIPYTAVWVPPVPPGTNASSVGFSYDEACLNGQPDASPPLLGTAGGRFTVVGGTLTLATGTLSGATLSGTFSWTRVTAGAALSLSGLTITAPSTTAISLDSTGLLGQGMAAFVWGVPAGTCAVQVANQTATVGGVAVQAV